MLIHHYGLFPIFFGMAPLVLYIRTQFLEWPLFKPQFFAMAPPQVSGFWNGSLSGLRLLEWPLVRPQVFGMAPRQATVILSGPSYCGI